MEPSRIGRLLTRGEAETMDTIQHPTPLHRSPPKHTAPLLPAPNPHPTPPHCNLHTALHCTALQLHCIPPQRAAPYYIALQLTAPNCTHCISPYHCIWPHLIPTISLCTTLCPTALHNTAHPTHRTSTPHPTAPPCISPYPTAPHHTAPCGFPSSFTDGGRLFGWCQGRCSESHCPSPWAIAGPTARITISTKRFIKRLAVWNPQVIRVQWPGHSPPPAPLHCLNAFCCISYL